MEMLANPVASGMGQLERCEKCKATLQGEAGASGAPTLGDFLQHVCTREHGTRDQCEAIRVRYRANHVHDSKNIDRALGDFCSEFFEVPCDVAQR